MSNIKFEEVQGLLDSGKDPEEVFDDILDEKEGFRVVYLNDKQNYLSDKNKLLFPDLWFDECSNYFEEGFASVKIKNKGWNYINEKGSIVFDNWFYSVETFYKGFAIVEDIDKGWNIINICGNIMSDSWFNTRNDANIFLLKLYSKDFEKYNFNFVWRFLANIDKKFYEFDDNQYGIQSIKIDYEANPKIVINRKEKKFLPYNIELAEVIELIKNVLNMNENGK